MNSLIRVKIKELKVGAKFQLSLNDKQSYTISDIDSQVAYCNHFIGSYVLPLERFVYVDRDKEMSPNSCT